ncbi:MAG TPA: VTT domain-containing protein [Candidatus Dormibacteraeota bacterium]|nr:VTT domain-containing protein [Candidatus Dormibacteraeota bacterium]
MIGSLEHVIHFLFNVKGLIEWGGTLLVCVIVFVETGFFVGFFLPGDSLLITAGIFAASGQLHLAELLLVVPLCAIVGDQVGYWIGRKAGQALYRRKDSLLFRRRHLDRAHHFYEKYGGKTVILARFVPIVRTFCPPVAGAALMPYGRYLIFDIAGGILWVGSTLLGGFFLGRKIPNISENIHYVIAVVILLSLLPPAISLLRSRYSGAPRPPAAPQPAPFERD